MKVEVNPTPGGNVEVRLGSRPVLLTRNDAETLRAALTGFLLEVVPVQDAALDAPASWEELGDEADKGCDDPPAEEPARSTYISNTYNLYYCSCKPPCDDREGCTCHPT